MQVLSSPNFRRARVGFAAAVLSVAFAAALAVGGAERAGAVKATLVGKTKKVPASRCPKTPCEGVGNMTGFQVSADGKKGLFRIPQEGHIVAWSVKTSRPNAEQREFFGDFYRNDTFGRTPVARIAIVRREEGSKTKYELRKQSPVVPLARELGSPAVITLNRPLKVKKGDILALTIPTWLSSFAVDLTNRDVWRASRSPNKCESRDIPDGKPHRKVGSIRKYGCRYSHARLLYWGYLAPDRGDKERRR